MGPCPSTKLLALIASEKHVFSSFHFSFSFADDSNSDLISTVDLQISTAASDPSQPPYFIIPILFTSPIVDLHCWSGRSNSYQTPPPSPYPQPLISPLPIPFPPWDRTFPFFPLTPLLSLFHPSVLIIFTTRNLIKSQETFRNFKVGPFLLPPLPYHSKGKSQPLIIYIQRRSSPLSPSILPTNTYPFIPANSSPSLIYNIWCPLIFSTCNPANHIKP